MDCCVAKAVALLDPRLSSSRILATTAPPTVNVNSRTFVVGDPPCVDTVQKPLPESYIKAPPLSLEASVILFTLLLNIWLGPLGPC